MPARLVYTLALLAAAAKAEEVKYNRLPADILQARLAGISIDNAVRADLLQKLFAEAGCPPEQLALSKVSGSKLPNIICSLPGTSPDTIVVGAHYDKAGGQGQGAVDNWTGSVLLTALYQSLASNERKFTFMFVGFSDEEKGLVGSKSFVKDLKANRLNVRAMVNIDSVGMEPTKVWVTRADKRLLEWAGSVAASLGTPLKGISVDQVGDSDSHPFIQKKIPVIDFHSLSQENIGVIHSKKDQLAAVNPVHYDRTYFFLTVLLAYIDLKLAAGD